MSAACEKYVGKEKRLLPITVIEDVAVYSALVVVTDCPGGAVVVT